MCHGPPAVYDLQFWTCEVLFQTLGFVLSFLFLQTSGIDILVLLLMLIS